MVISFIIIGKNEEKNLKRCINSIYKGIHAIGVSAYEIIYVDSNSTDKSIEVAMSFPEVTVYKITGPSNAAMGRNVGARHASGKVLFFVDGDMEIYTDFLARYWNSTTNDIDHPIIAGQWLDVVEPEPVKRRSSDIFPGGSFLIKRSVWESVNGMRTRFKTGEESDLMLRLMKKGHRLLRPRNEFIIKHYTVPYMDSRRIWKSMWNKNIFYNRAVMYRHHFFDKNAWELMWRADKTFILLVLTIIIAVLYWPAGIVLGIVYLGAIVMRAIKTRIDVSLPQMTAFYFLSDFLNIVNFFTFFPKDLREEYAPVKSRVLQHKEH